MSGSVHPLFPRAARKESSATPVAPPERALAAEHDAVLIVRVARGDHAAHRVLFDRHHARVAAFLRRRLADPGLREEVLSDVFFEVWRGASAYRGESPVTSWIFGIAHFKALAARRSQGQGKRAAVL